jgi:hypothetical protein
LKDDNDDNNNNNNTKCKELQHGTVKFNRWHQEVPAANAWLAKIGHFAFKAMYVQRPVLLYSVW